MDKQANQNSQLSIYKLLQASAPRLAREVDVCKGVWLWSDNVLILTHSSKFIHLVKDVFGLWRYWEFSGYRSLHMLCGDIDEPIHMLNPIVLRLEVDALLMKYNFKLN